MPKKGKKGNRPALQHHNNDSLRRDIEVGRNAPIDGVIDPFADDNDDGAFDIADELLAALDERDAAAEAAEKPSPNNHSGGGLREAGGRLISGLRHHNHDADATAQTGTSPTHNRKSSIRKLFGSSPKSPESSAPLDAAAAPKKKVSRQQQRKVGPPPSPRFPQLLTNSLHICIAANRIVKPPRLQKCVVRPRKKSSSAPTSPTKHRSNARVSLPCARHSVLPCTKSRPTVIASTLLSRTSSTFARSSMLPSTTRPRAAPPLNRCAPTRTNTNPSSRTRTNTWQASSTAKPERSTPSRRKRVGRLHHPAAHLSRRLTFALRLAEYFLDYCSAVENTGVWGGQPEILALSRAFGTQIHVIQAGVPVLKVGEGEYDGEPLTISYVDMSLHHHRHSRLVLTLSFRAVHLQISPQDVRPGRGKFAFRRFDTYGKLR